MVRVDVDLTTGEDAPSDVVMEDTTMVNEEGSTVPQDTSDALNQLTLSKDLKLFLNDVISMTKCPISRDQMINPFVAPDSFSYEKDEISEWLRTKTISPMTREIMHF